MTPSRCSPAVELSRPASPAGDGATELGCHAARRPWKLYAWATAAGREADVARQPLRALLRHRRAAACGRLRVASTGRSAGRRRVISGLGASSSQATSRRASRARRSRLGDLLELGEAPLRLSGPANPCDVRWAASL